MHYASKRSRNRMQENTTYVIEIINKDRFFGHICKIPSAFHMRREKINLPRRLNTKYRNDTATIPTIISADIYADIALYTFHNGGYSAPHNCHVKRWQSAVNLRWKQPPKRTYHQKAPYFSQHYLSHREYNKHTQKLHLTEQTLYPAQKLHLRILPTLFMWLSRYKKTLS